MMHEEGEITPLASGARAPLTRPHFFKSTVSDDGEEETVSARLEIGQEEEKDMGPQIGRTELESARVVNYGEIDIKADPFNRQAAREEIMHHRTEGFEGHGHVRSRRRKGVWTPVSIGLMVLGFVIFWPLGLAVLAYNIWAEPGDFQRWVNRHGRPVLNEARGLNNDIGASWRRFEADMRALSEEMREAWRRWKSRKDVR